MRLSAGFGGPFGYKGEPARGSCRETPARGPEQPLRCSIMAWSRWEFRVFELVAIECPSDSDKSHSSDRSQRVINYNVLKGI